jgi:hypothetical protein
MEGSVVGVTWTLVALTAVSTAVLTAARSAAALVPLRVQPRVEVPA